eukprot:CAMPEP_0172771932 /NCGR_PEP_ID=MMETSP1074-20121228/191471_1 /TAXON_ID=2916 /ORGANISM="Ceratium fusus, Strain PA161109" /LENGTH=66 /DNA_ID=CAMNT_0013607957 /DNA_START=295 /DNA_END=495 /DNA_ORIENTATION=-
MPLLALPVGFASLPDELRAWAAARTVLSPIITPVPPLLNLAVLLSPHFETGPCGNGARGDSGGGTQ